MAGGNGSVPGKLIWGHNGIGWDMVRVDRLHHLIFFAIATSPILDRNKFVKK